VDAIVALSIRYGIITPYTSFLIEEDDIFSESGREAISRDFQAEMAAEAAAPSYGSSAVQKAAFQGEMAAAEAPLSGPMMLLPTTTGADGGVSEPVKVGEVLKQIGSKTFVLRNETWTDTAFDGSKMETEKVEFLSDEYFDLILENSVLGDYFALGERVIVVYDGTAYEIVEV